MVGLQPHVAPHIGTYLDMLMAQVPASALERRSWAANETLAETGQGIFDAAVRLAAHVPGDCLSPECARLIEAAEEAWRQADLPQATLWAITRLALEEDAGNRLRRLCWRRGPDGWWLSSRVTDVVGRRGDSNNQRALRILSADGMWASDGSWLEFNGVQPGGALGARETRRRRGTKPVKIGQ
jgi:hypothetical protein